jgi:hypothetical protein
MTPFDSATDAFQLRPDVASRGPSTLQRNLADPIALGHVDVDRRALRGLPAAMAARMEPPPGADAAALSARIPLDASTLATTMRRVHIYLHRSPYDRVGVVNADP